MGIIKEYFKPQKKVKMSKGGPLGMGKWGFIAPELAQFAYALLTVLVILFTWTTIDNPQDLLLQRMTFLSGTLALWMVYQLWPSKVVMLFRVIYLLLMLGSWYPDTYEINKQFLNLDNVFAEWEQTVFGFQPALLFSERYSSRIVSELMYFGYFSYYLFFVVTTLIVAIRHYEKLERVTFMLMSAFFICYVIYLFLPVTGPQYYYLAAGMEQIAGGVFPDVEHHFRSSMECMAAPGWGDGLFYNLCQSVHQTGERPTAAFPSSHVAIATLVMLIVTRMGMWRYLLTLAVPYAFLCLSTVYIRAHYAIDAIAGFVFGFVLFALLGGMKLKK